MHEIEKPGLKLVGFYLFTNMSHTIKSFKIYFAKEINIREHLIELYVACSNYPNYN